MALVLSIEDLQLERKQWINDRFHLLATEEYILLINTNSDLRELANYVFAGIGELSGLFGNVAGLVGGITAGITGDKFKKWLENLSEDKADKRVGEALEILEQNADPKKGMTKILWSDLENLQYKKGILVTPTFQLRACGEEHAFRAADRDSVKRLVEASKRYAPQAISKRVWR